MATSWGGTVRREVGRSGMSVVRGRGSKTTWNSTGSGKQGERGEMRGS